MTNRSRSNAEKVFLIINIAFAMYSGALLCTGARLAWDPSTYAWFRYMCGPQYQVSAVYVACAGVWLAALVVLGVWGRRPPALRLYAAGVVVLALTEVAYMSWMAVSLHRWWRTAPQAELARQGMDILHDLKPALLAVERYQHVARPVYEMIEEVERNAPNNVYVILLFAMSGAILQIAAVVMAHKLSRRSVGSPILVGQERGEKEEREEGEEKETCAECAARAGRHEPPGWRQRANLRLYTVLDKVF